MELMATMALDRDAINTVTLRLLPPSAAPGAAVSSWLLWHTIPITASLSRTLSRLVSIEASAMTHMPLDDTADAAAMCHSAHRSHDRKARSPSAASASSSSSSASASSALSTRTRLTCSTAEAEKTSWIELARVGYVVSEIHAYCILLKCRRAAQAARLKAALEEGAALGLTAPVEYVTDARPVVVTHCAFAERRGRAEAVGADGTSITGHHLPRVRARWCTGDHMVSLWEAIATVYPVRGNGGSGGDDGDGDSASDGDGEHHDTRGSLQRHHQYHHHPYHLQSSPHTASSAPVTPSPARQSPAASSAMRKGAAPPPSRHASAVTVAAAASTPKHTPLSSAKAAGRASPSRPPHTPPHLPLTGRGGRGGVDLGPLLSGDFCTICLDPLYLSACVTTLCQHSFHLSCYAQLPSGSAECPLCRFSVYDLLNDARCKVCGTYEDLWVCLICGHVACGRARRDHQQEHYHASGHSCSWQSTTNRMRNLSSRMFLHQEVALLLEEDGVDDAATADSPHSVGSATRLRSAEAGTSSEEAATTAMGGTLSPSDADRVRYMSWSDSLVDHDLQEALNESKEEAVAQYYTQFLRQLAEEQQRWYEARLAERRRCRRERQMATVAMAGGRRAESASSSAAGWLSNVAPSAHTALHRIAVDERRLRRRVLSEYVQATISLLQAAQREYAGMTHTLRAARDDAQQQVLLRSHFNSGLMAQVERVRQRTRELQRKGETAAQQKAAEEAELQRLVDEALSSL
ncbi:Ring finger domain/Zn finger-containing protein [Leishmania donovani]|uniref:Ring_finger_domain/Zn-finger_in_ubiquitin-hydrola ses_and_other_protein_putative/Pfam:PF13639/Pfam:PF02148 n=1 Tax=Leishmania donovani TaxID=5661 RepID=A0A6J8F1T9_LEIDO|nr:Ring finger domain/Zn finger-containing protein [Leishmania donovani]VDZ41535.1 Ring_finger_domain/Zn-finger_in_ubiquitin-hydrolases_and_other_protein_putative/Pfam:PF13639/Pfam:PF02148 [Leishmania donovani]